MIDLESLKGINLDIGCGESKQPNFIGMDKRLLPGVDILHDLEEFPYPLPDECCWNIVGSHIIEHIKPEYSIPFMDELWRLMKPNGKLALSTPYAGSPGYWQDPTHCNGWTEATFRYFAPIYNETGEQINILYGIYQPKPWKIEHITWQFNGNLEVVLVKPEVEYVE
jgi:SAM-dependent methyltransferase